LEDIRKNLSTLHKLRRTNVIDVNHWARVANKAANINVENRSLYANLRRYYTSKTADIKEGDIAQQYIDT